MADALYGEHPKPKAAGWWKWALAILLALLFVYRSARPVAQLHTDPPPSFYDYSKTWTPAERIYHHRLADAYWRIAVRRIQPYYSADRPLPSDPPPQFQISGASTSTMDDPAASRIHYWYRLREVWNQPDTWMVSYTWNTNWVERAVRSLPQDVPHSVRNSFQGIINFFNGITQSISAS